MNSAGVSRLIKLHGSTKSLPSVRLIRAGNLTLEYENGSIRYITASGVELVRMIYAAVRDDKWITVEPVISNENIKSSGNKFRISYKALYRYKSIDFDARYVFTGGPGNRIVVEMKGRANATFLRNRIGFCVLHPIGTCKGLECLIFHPDGTRSKAIFPEEISPHQPFMDISAMQWNIGPIQAELSFFGDTFETEDQRNWTDSSYKTYSTPLKLPFPVSVRKNTVIHQKVKLIVNGQATVSEKPATKVVFGCTGSDSLPLPSVGTSMSSRPEKMTLHEAELLKHTCFSHLRAEIHLFSGDSYGQYEKMSSESRLLDLPVELCLVTGSNWSSDLQQFLTVFRNNPVPLSSIILLSQNHRATPAELISEGIPFIRKHFKNVAAGAGTNCNFAQLNRQPPDPALLDFISFAIHPQEHAGDDRTLFENTAAQRDAVESAVKLAGRKSVHVSPVTLVRRFNAGESNYEIASVHKLLPAQVDVRQMSLFGAAWTIGSMKYLFESGVESVTYYEGVGERGIMTGDYPSAWPLEFRADKDMLYPMYHIFRLLKRKYRVIRSVSNFPLVVDGLVLVAENGGIIFLSNFTATDQTVEIRGFTGLQTFFLMNTTNFNKVVRNTEFPFPLLNTGTTIGMKPYETRFLKFASQGQYSG